MRLSISIQIKEEAMPPAIPGNAPTLAEMNDLNGHFESILQCIEHGGLTGRLLDGDGKEVGDWELGTEGEV